MENKFIVCAVTDCTASKERWESQRCSITVRPFLGTWDMHFEIPIDQSQLRNYQVHDILTLTVEPPPS
jgi:hypothetical protein